MAQRKIWEGKEAVTNKVLSARILSGPEYSDQAASEYTGVSPSPWQKYQRCRTLQEGISSANILGGLHMRDRDPSDCYPKISNTLAVTAGLSWGVVKFANLNGMLIEPCKLRNDRLPVQCGFILKELISFSGFSRLANIDYQKGQRVLAHQSSEIIVDLAELIDRANSELFRCEELRTVLEEITIENIADFMAISIPYAWPFFLMTEVIQSEILDNTSIPLAGVFDEFWVYRESTCNHFYWNRRAA